MKKQGELYLKIISIVLVAVVLAYRNQSLIVVALASSGAAFLAERLLGLPF